MKRIRRLSLLVGPLMVVMMLATLVAGISPAQAARTTRSTAITTAGTCPTDASAITSLSVRITRNGNTLNASSNLSNVQPGDTVKVTFDLDNDCSNYKVSLVSYKAADDSNNLETLYLRQVHSSKSLTFGPSGGSLQVTVPDCYFATVFAVGSVLTSMSSTKQYGNRQKDLKNGGTSACSGIAPPSSAPQYYGSAELIPFDGNPTCATLGNYFGEDWDQYKIDSGPQNGTYNFSEPGYWAQISNSNVTTNFGWSSNAVIRGVFVKASNQGNLYRYASGATSDNGLLSVGKPDGSGAMYDISHVQFCYRPLPTIAQCPAGKSAITDYRFEVWRGSTRINATDLNGIRQGDLIKAFFDLAPGCANIELSFAAYKAVEPYYNINTVHLQEYMPYPQDTGLFTATMSDSERMVQTLAPSCNFQVDFVHGAIIENLTPNNLYGSRKIAWKNGGSNDCDWGGPPTNTPTVTTVAPTPRLQPTNTPDVAKTQTAVAMPTATNTAVAPTNTAVVPTATNTAVAPTATNTAVATATTPAGATATNTAEAATATNTAVAPTNTAVPPTATNTAVPPTATNTAVPTATNTAVPTATNTAVPTATNTAVPPDGDLLIHKRDSEGFALGGACFQVTGPGFDNEVCDNDANDGDSNDGEVLLAGLEPGTYAVLETEPPIDYLGDDTTYQVLVPSGGLGEVTIVNTEDIPETTTDVYMYKLNCESQPSSVDPVSVANGTMPADGNCVMAPANVTFDIRDQNGALMYEGVMTDANGRVVFNVAASVTSISIVEYPETNPLMQPPPSPYVFDDVHCPCGYSYIAVVNLAAEPAP